MVLRTLRLLGFMVVLAFVVAACGGADGTDTASSGADDESSESSDAAEQNADDADDSDPDSSDDLGADSEAEDATSSGDDRTEEEIAIDRLDLMILQLGVPRENLVTAADCVIERLDDEDQELVGQGSPELAALLGCEPAVAEQLFSVGSLPAANSQCVSRGIGTWVTELPLSEADAFFNSTVPPDALVDQLSEDCNIDREALAAILG